MTKKTSFVGLIFVLTLAFISCSTESKLSSFCGNAEKLIVLLDSNSVYWVFTGSSVEKLEGLKIRIQPGMFDLKKKVTTGKGEGDQNLIKRELINMWKTQSGGFQSTGSEVMEYRKRAKIFDCVTGALNKIVEIKVKKIIAIQNVE